MILEGCHLKKVDIVNHSLMFNFWYLPSGDKSLLVQYRLLIVSTPPSLSSTCVSNKIDADSPSTQNKCRGLLFAVQCVIPTLSRRVVGNNSCPRAGCTLGDNQTGGTPTERERNTSLKSPFPSGVKPGVQKYQVLCLKMRHVDGIECKTPSGVSVRMT